MDDLLTDNTQYTRLIGSTMANEGGDPVASISFEMNPLDDSCDLKIKGRVKSQTFVVHYPIIDAIMQFFGNDARSAVTESLSGWKNDMVVALQKQASTSLAKQVQRHQTIDLDIVVHGSSIVLPNDPRSSGSDQLICKTGDFTVSCTPMAKEQIKLTISELKKYTAVLSEIKAEQVDVSLQEKLYDRFHLTSEATHLYLCKAVSGASAIEAASNIVDPFTVEFSIERAITQLPWLPDMRVKGCLPSLNFHVSIAKFTQLMNIVRTFEPLGNKTVAKNKVETLQKKIEKTQGFIDVAELTSLIGDEDQAMQYLAQAQANCGKPDRITRAEFYAWWRAREAEKFDHNTTLKLEFSIPHISCTFVDDGLAPLEISVQGISTSLIQIGHEVDVSFNLCSFAVQALGTQPFYFVRTTEQPWPVEMQKSNFISGHVHTRSRLSSSWEATPIATDVNVEVATLIVEIDPEQVDIIFTFVDRFIAASDAGQASDASASLPSVDLLDGKAAVQTALEKQDSVSSNYSSVNRTESIVLKLAASFQSFIIRLRVGDRQVAEFKMGGVNTNIMQYPLSLEANFGLASVFITDFTLADSLHPHIVESGCAESQQTGCAVDDKNTNSLVTIIYKTHDVRESCYPGHDVGIVGIMSGLRVRYLNRFVMELVSFFLAGPFGARFSPKEAAEQEMLDLETSSSSPSPTPSKLFLSLTFQDLFLVVPVSSHSLDVLTSHLQSLKVC